jgi:hypothetical protein
MTATIPSVTATDDLRVLAVACPPASGGGCGSDPEARCTTPSGRATRPHTARVRAALAATPTAPYSHPYPGEAGVPGAEAPAGTYAVGADGTATPEPEPEPAAAVGPSVDELVLRLLVLKVLAARIAEADADTRDAIHGRVDVGVSLPGYLTAEDAAAARAGEVDRCLGKVGLSKPSRSWKVTDAEAFTAWVLEHAPDEVEHRPVVRNSFVSAVLASCKADGGWVTPSGEILEPAGVELSLGRPTLQVRPSADAPDLVAAALAAGMLTADGVRALPAGTSA